jgi:hypothetical protein
VPLAALFFKKRKAITLQTSAEKTGMEIYMKDKIVTNDETCVMFSM